MNNTVSLTGLTARLALRENLTEEAAHKLVTDFFNVIEQSLASGDDVTVSGLGRFFVEDGEVKFSADEVFAATVNEPFEMFVPLVLSGEIEAEPEIIEEEAETEEDVSESVEPAPEVIVEHVHEFVEEVVNESESEAEDVEESEPEEDVDSEAIDEGVAGPPPFRPEVFAKISIYEAMPEEVVADVVDEVQDDSIVEKPKRRYSLCCVLLWALICLIVGLVLGVVIGFR